MIFKFSGLSGFNSTKQSRGITYNIVKVLNGNKLSEKERLRKKILYTCIFCIIYAIFDEIHQIYVPGRTGKVIDVVIDTLGAFMGIAIILLNDKINNKI